ncbi:tRNA-splicing endonuclease subunit [Acrasis kona]|uniref:tRNA-intron lyase n=1 Tax=Acrasis kona TaxID=1008807 RepID=A0AAW2Z3G0_9EUKA
MEENKRAPKEYQISKFKNTTARLVGRYVLTDNFDLYEQGFFGKGMLSRSRPQQVVEFSLDDDTKEQIREELLLTLHEAFYLVYALGCLQVTHQGKVLTIHECFEKFCEMEGYEFFLSRYASYHYFRCRGWIVKSGVKYGCDFMLYRLGPELDHSKYCTRIVPIINGQKDEMPWKELQHQSRLSISVAKILVVTSVRIDTPNNQDVTTLVKSSTVKQILDCVSIEMIQTTRFMP